jgi:sugar lactone lactonase YvrE
MYPHLGAVAVGIFILPVLFPPLFSGLAAELPENSFSVIVGSRLATEGGAADGKSPLAYPLGIDFDRHGNLFIVELSGGRVHRLDPDGKLQVIAGKKNGGYAGDGGPASEAEFWDMHNLAIGADDALYIADSSNHCIRKIDPKTGRISTLAGDGTEGFDGDVGRLEDVRFRKPICIALSPDKKRLLVADIYNLRIREIELAGGSVRTLAGTGQSGVPRDGVMAAENPLVDPRAVAADSRGNLYILERAGHALRLVDSNGRIFTVAGTGKKGFRDGPAMEAEFAEPKHLCIDDRNRVYIADDKNDAIRLYDPHSGTVSTVLGRGRGGAELKGPHGVCFHGGRLYVVDSGNHRVLALAPAAK